MSLLSTSVDLLIGIFAVISGTLTVIGFLSYWRSGSKRILLVSIAFLLFFLKGIALVVGLYLLKEPIFLIPTRFGKGFAILMAMDSLALLTLYFALFRRR
ncbi:MAG: hypothetical protein J7L88_05445 [Thermoplasmata archaeon]|nr:hypothetical protein [Thermoplasmata archaeon]